MHRGVKLLEGETWEKALEERWEKMRRNRGGFGVCKKEESVLELTRRYLYEAPLAPLLLLLQSLSRLDLHVTSLPPLQPGGIATPDDLQFLVPILLLSRWLPKQADLHRHVGFRRAAPTSLRKAPLAHLLIAPLCKQPLPLQLPRPSVLPSVLFLSSA